jgi:hypothetical protein
MVICHRSQVKKIPKTIRDYMRHKFNLPVEYLGTLRCLANMRSNNGKLSAIISIFSPVRAQEYNLAIKTIADLGRYPEMVLFKGHIDSHGDIEIADRRGPMRGYRPEQQ